MVEDLRRQKEVAESMIVRECIRAKRATKAAEMYACVCVCDGGMIEVEEAEGT